MLELSHQTDPLPVEHPETPAQEELTASKGRLAKELQLPLTVVFLILGLVLATQVRTQQEIRKTPAGNRVEVLASRLQETQDRLEQMKDEVDSLRKTVANYEHAASQQNALIGQMNNELQEAKAAAGLLPVRGPGVVVQLEDSPLRLPSSQEQDAYLVHDIDILQLVNELRAAGAEAISVNGQRIVATSEIRCVGPSIKINNTTVASPYKVTAIGDPDALKSALELPLGILETLRALKIQAKVLKQEVVTVPAVQTGPVYKYGKPVFAVKPAKVGEPP